MATDNTPPIEYVIYSKMRKKCSQKIRNTSKTFGNTVPFTEQ